MKSSSLVPPSLAKQSAKRFAEQGISKRSNHTRTHIKNSTKQWVQFPRPSLPRKELQYHHHPQQIIQPKETAWTRPFNSTSAFVTRLYPVCLQKSSNYYSPMVIEHVIATHWAQIINEQTSMLNRHPIGEDGSHYASPESSSSAGWSLVQNGRAQCTENFKDIETHRRPSALNISSQIIQNGLHCSHPKAPCS